MRALAAAELLDLIDLADEASPMARAVLLLSAAYGDEPSPIEHWTLGRVNAGLLRLRALLFGRTLECLANCPKCGAICESELDCLEMAGLRSDDADRGDGHAIEFEGAQISFRLPTAADLLAVGRSRSDAGALLLDRLIAPGSAEPPDRTAFAGALSRAVADADPLARIELVLRCPECAAEWTEPFHAIDILWTEFRSLSARLVHDVARLAQAFGWREADILAMSARRRQRYLDLVPA